MDRVTTRRSTAIEGPYTVRLKIMPDIPTLAEVGQKDFEADIWFIAAAPAHTSKDVASQLASWLLDALRDPGIIPKLDAQGLFSDG